MVKKYLLNREALFHLVFWLLFFSMVNVDWTADWFDATIRNRHPAPLSVLLFPVFFYLHALWLLPCYLRRKRWLGYIGWGVAALILPELLRALLVSLLDPTANPLPTGFSDALFGRDSFLFGSPSPVWYAILLSFAYRFTKDWVVNVRRIERLEAEGIQNELRLLKTQINPHFLFNNLNTLDDLIDRDPALARIYLHKLSGLYRYILQSSEQDVVSLQKEWDFCDDYIFLLEERFGGAYRFDRSAGSIDLARYVIPPAALQGLLENVVKHNEGDPRRPLVTTIKADENGLVVSHPKRLKKATGSVSGTGLANLRARFQLISNQLIQVEDGADFTVTLPLIKLIT